MSATVVATVEASNVPPRVRLDVTSPGGVNTLTTVIRLDADGRTVPVRTSDGNPLSLSPSGPDTVGLLYDYEMPYGTVVRYGTAESGMSSALVSVTAARPWLVHVGVPTLSVQLGFFRPGAFAEESEDVSQGVFWPLGRSTPVVISDGARKSPQSQFTVLTQTASDVAAFKAVTRDVSTLLLNVPPALGFGVDTNYISVGKVTYKRVVPLLQDPMRDVNVPYTVVARPAGGSQSQRSYADVLSAFSTYGDVLSAYTSYADLLAPTS